MDPIITPKISVLMPVYNCRPFIEESVNSILNQTFTDFEFLIIDDCSTDGTYEYIQSLTDPRIRLIRKDENSGISDSLNMGIDIAQGEYIARMDGDDISLPHRFERQLNFLEQNREYILCGTWIQLFGNNRPRVLEKPISDFEIKKALFDHSAIAHPSVMFRGPILKTLELKYDILMEPAEDFDLWVRLSEYGKFANLPEVLLEYRIHDSQVSQVMSITQVNKANRCRMKMISKAFKFDPIDSNTIEMIFNIQSIKSTASLLKIIEWVKTYRSESEIISGSAQAALLHNLSRSFFNYFSFRNEWNFNILREYLVARREAPVYHSFIAKGKFFIKCFLYYKIRLTTPVAD